MGPLLGYAGWTFYRRGKTGRDPGPLSAWVGLFTLALFTHPLIDIHCSLRFIIQIIAGQAKRPGSFYKAAIIILGSIIDT